MSYNYMPINRCREHCQQTPLHSDSYTDVFQPLFYQYMKYTLKQSKVDVLVCPSMTGLQTTRVLDIFKSTDERMRMYKMSTMYYLYTRGLSIINAVLTSSTLHLNFCVCTDFK